MNMNEQDPLKSLLREWEAPGPPARLDARIGAAFAKAHRSSLWRRIWSVRISVPAPILAAALVLMVLGLWLGRRPAPAPVAPGLPAAGGYLTRLETSGFQPLTDGQFRVIRSGGLNQ